MTALPAIDEPEAGHLPARERLYARDVLVWIWVL